MQKDYYRVLQVHHEASQEVVEAAYRRLCKIFHPDLNRHEHNGERMKEINLAYEVLGNPGKRVQYHKEWLGAQGTQADPGAAQGMDEAYEQMDGFFRDLMNGQWSSAYQRLTSLDRKNVTLEDFTEWKKTVNDLYKVGSYAVKPFRNYTNCTVGTVTYEEVREFSVYVSDMDVHTGRVSEENHLKHAALESGAWRICLGYKDVRPLTLRYRHMLQNLTRIDPAQVYADAVMSRDGQTGLLSRQGFLEHAEQEAVRSRRYGNKFTVALFTVVPKGSIAFSEEEYFDMCLAHAVKAMRASTRQTDICGRWSQNELTVLFTETSRQGAISACEKLVGIMGSGDTKYRVNYGIAAFDGYSVEDTILAAASDAQRFSGSSSAFVYTNESP